MRAISKKSVPYVCESDRSLPKEEQTVFLIKPKTYQEVNNAMRRYGGTFKEDGQGFKDYDVSKLNSADQQEWCSVVEKIENFCFSEDYLKKYPEIPHKEGFVEVITDSSTKLDVLSMLPVNVINEIWKATQDVTKLKEGEKKD